MSIAVEVLDPRHDPEPAYWPQLQARTARPASWSYELLRLASWNRRVPLLVSVLRDRDALCGVVCAGLPGTAWRPWAFAGPQGRPVLSVLDVFVPLTPSEPGWWLAAESGERRAELLAAYATGMRAELGWHHRGVLWREVGALDSGALPGRVRLARPLNPVARLATPWDDRGGWLASLGKSRTVDLRRQLRQIEADPSVVSAMGPARALVKGAEIADLKRENELKYSGRLTPPPLPASYLEALIGLDEAVAITFRDTSGRLIAVGLILDHPAWPLFLMWGALPVGRGGRRHLYFVAMAEAVGWSIAQRRKGLVLGKGKAALKGDLGADFIPCRAVAVPCLVPLGRKARPYRRRSSRSAPTLKLAEEGSDGIPGERDEAVALIARSGAVPAVRPAGSRCDRGAAPEGAMLLRDLRSCDHQWEKRASGSGARRRGRPADRRDDSAHGPLAAAAVRR